MVVSHPHIEYVTKIKSLKNILFKMFNLDNIELDFDEDFSSNIFSKRSNSFVKNTAEPENICPKSGITQSLHKTIPDEKTILAGFLSPSLANASRDNKLKRPLVEDEKPQKKRLSHEGLLQRKFPGPAGLLPDKPLKEMADFPLLVEKSLDEEEESLEKEEPVIYSQCSGSVFMESSYQKLVTEFNLKEAKNPLSRYTVEWVKKKALSKGLQGRKIPFLGLVVHVVNHSMPDPVLVLRDPTGEISGSLHREVWAELGGKLRSGIALALRQVGVLITGVIRRQIYLNITMNNILAIYSPSENEREVEITTVNKVSKSELAKSFAEWLAPQRTAPARPLPPSSPFTTVGSSRPSPPANRPIHNLNNTPEDSRHGRKGGEGGADALSDWDMVINAADFTEEMQIPRRGSEPETSRISSPLNPSTQPLSPAESLIFQEVLSGINLDEFEM